MNLSFNLFKSSKNNYAAAKQDNKKNQGLLSKIQKRFQNVWDTYTLKDMDKSFKEISSDIKSDMKDLKTNINNFMQNMENLKTRLNSINKDLSHQDSKIKEYKTKEKRAVEKWERQAKQNTNLIKDETIKADVIKAEIEAEAINPNFFSPISLLINSLLGSAGNKISALWNKYTLQDLPGKLDITDEMKGFDKNMADFNQSMENLKKIKVKDNLNIKNINYKEGSINIPDINLDIPDINLDHINIKTADSSPFNECGNCVVTSTTNKVEEDLSINADNNQVTVVDNAISSIGRASEDDIELKIGYKVKSGDTLTKIASLNNTTVDNLIKLNNIDNPDLIHEGDILVIK